MSVKLLAAGLVLLGVVDLVAAVGVATTLGPILVFDPARPWPIWVLRGLVGGGALLVAALVPVLTAWSAAALLWGGHPWGRVVARVAALLHLPVPILGWGVALASIEPSAAR